MRKSRAKKETPIYDLESFSEKALRTQFYVELLSVHLKEHQFINRPHKHDFYLVLIVTEGGGTHTIDFVDYDMNPGSCFVMTPGQVHNWSLRQQTEGYVVFFTKDFYQYQANDINLFQFPFFNSAFAQPTAIIPDRKTTEFVTEQMLVEFNKTASPLQKRLLRSYLDVLLLKLSAGFGIGSSQVLTTSQIKLRKLEQLIEQHFIKKHQPYEYAELMHVSPSYLNSICKAQLDKTLTQLIQERIILEAKRLFSYSEFNVNEVARRLTFTDVSYFIRLFKKQVGVTPEQFRVKASQDR